MKSLTRLAPDGEIKTHVFMDLSFYFICFESTITLMMSVSFYHTIQYSIHSCIYVSSIYDDGTIYKNYSFIYMNVAAR